MSDRTYQPPLDFDAAEAALEDGDALVVDVDGFEGPLDLLLSLARQQKVDLLAISITKLADQFLAFVQEARRKRFSLAADYLVMAAWLAFLKSRLMLPKKALVAEVEGDPEDMARELALRLVRLDAVRRGVEALKARPQLRREVFPRGDPQSLVITSTTRFDEDLYALAQAYAQQRKRAEARAYIPTGRVEAYPLEAARERLRGLLPDLEAWSPLALIAPRPAAGVDGPSRASCLASTLSAGLEMVKEGALEAQQAEILGEVYLRARTPVAASL